MGIADQINRTMDDPDPERVTTAWNRPNSADTELREDLGVILGHVLRSLSEVQARLVELAKYVEAKLSDS